MPERVCLSSASGASVGTSMILPEDCSLPRHSETRTDRMAFSMSLQQPLVGQPVKQEPKLFKQNAGAPASALRLAEATCQTGSPVLEEPS